MSYVQPTKLVPAHPYGDTSEESDTDTSSGRDRSSSFNDSDRDPKFSTDESINNNEDMINCDDGGVHTEDEASPLMDEEVLPESDLDQSEVTEGSGGSEVTEAAGRSSEDADLESSQSSAGAMAQQAPQKIDPEFPGLTGKYRWFRRSRHKPGCDGGSGGCWTCAMPDFGNPNLPDIDTVRRGLGANAERSDEELLQRVGIMPKRLSRETSYDEYYAQERMERIYRLIADFQATLVEERDRPSIFEGMRDAEEYVVMNYLVPVFNYGYGLVSRQISIRGELAKLGGVMRSISRRILRGTRVLPDPRNAARHEETSDSDWTDQDTESTDLDRTEEEAKTTAENEEEEDTAENTEEEEDTTENTEEEELESDDEWDEASDEASYEDTRSDDEWEEASDEASEEEPWSHDEGYEANDEVAGESRSDDEGYEANDEVTEEEPMNEEEPNHAEEEEPMSEEEANAQTEEEDRVMPQATVSSPCFTLAM